MDIIFYFVLLGVVALDNRDFVTSLINERDQLKQRCKLLQHDLRRAKKGGLFEYGIGALYLALLIFYWKLYLEFY